MTTRSCQTPNLLVRRIDDRSTVPTRGSSDAAGYDLYSSTDFTIHPGQRLLVSTGIAIEVPVRVLTFSGYLDVHSTATKHP